MMTMFANDLHKFRQFGPPKLPITITNHCDVAFADFINTSEIVKIAGNDDKHSVMIDVLDDVTQFGSHVIQVSMR